MNIVLEKRNPNIFRLRQMTSGEGFDQKVFEIFLNGQWSRFRTVTHIRVVYGRGYGIDDYFDEIVKIGAQITKIISERAGYARPGSRELLTVFGKYLAHYSVLERLHKQIKGEFLSDGSGSNMELVVDETAAFPSEIHELIESDFSAINSELSAWRESFLPSAKS